MNPTQALRLLVVPLLAALALGLAACGGDDEETATTGGAQAAPGNSIDRAFAAEMVVHHESAVEMAEIAKEQSKRKEITELADDIIATQTAEIETLRTAEGELADAGVEAGDLGMSGEMGMDTGMLRDAKPFDREFIDMMVAHHQSAIEMARIEIEKGESADLKALAEDVIEAQSREIEQMNEWRTDWFGEPSPAGGVPEEGADKQDDGGSMEGMDME